MAEGETILAKTNDDFSLFGAISIQSNINAAIPGLIRYNSTKDIFEGYLQNGRAYVNGSKFVPMSLDVATSSNLGGIKIGNNLSITATGILNAVASAVSRKFQKVLIVSASLQENTDPGATDGITTGDYRSINQCVEQFFGYDPITDTFPDGELASLNKDEYPDPAENNQYIILLTPGEYKEDLDLVDITKHQTIDLPPYVSLIGDDRDSCIINVKNLTSILMRNNTALKNLTIDLTNANTNLTPSATDEIIKGINILASANNITIDNVRFKLDTANFNTSFIYTNTNSNVVVSNILMKTGTIAEGVNSEIASTDLEIKILDITQSSINLDNLDIYIESNKHKKSIIYANDLSAINLNNSKLEIKETNLSSATTIQNQVVHLIDSIFTTSYSSFKCQGYDNNYTTTAIRNQGIRLDSTQNYNYNQSSQSVFIHNEAGNSHDTIKVPSATLDFSQYYVNGSKIKISGTSNNNSIIGTSYITTGTITEFGGSIDASVMGVDLSSFLTDEELNGITATFKELYQVNIFTCQITADSETIYFDASDPTKADNYYVQCSQTQINGVNPNIGDNSLIFDTNNEIIVGKEEGNYNSIADALNSITNATSTNKYTVYIKPGTYLESQQLLIPEYVSLIGDNSIVKFDSNSSEFPENVCIMLSSNCVIQNVEFYLDKVQDATKNNIAIASANYLSTMEANLTDETYFDALDQLTNITLQNIKFTLTDDFVNLNNLRCAVFCKVSNMNVNNTSININHSYTDLTELNTRLIYNKLTEITYNDLGINITGNIDNFDYKAIVNDGCTNTYNNPDILVNITPSNPSTLRLIETSDLLEADINKLTLSQYNTFVMAGSVRGISDVNITSLYALFAEYNSTLVAVNVVLEGDAASRNNSNNDYPNSFLKTMGCFQISSDGSLISEITEIDTRGNSAIANDSLHVGDPVGSLDNIPSKNVLVGIRVATLNSLGVRNIMMGVDVAKNQTSGNDNVYLGSNVAVQALDSENVFIGSNTASSLKTGSQNVIIGKNSGNTSNIVNRSVIIGNNNATLVNNLDEAIIIGSSSMNVTNSANLSNLMVLGSNGVGSSLQEGHKNIILGNYTMTNTQTSNENITIGHNSATTLTDATKNIIIGNDTCSSIATANNSIVIGTNNLSRVGSSTTTNNNLIMGNRAMLNTTTASDSIVLGTGAGRNITTGSRNIIMGQERFSTGSSTSTAKSLTTGSDNIILGSNTAITSTTGNRNFIIGNNSGNSLDITDDTIILGYNSGGNISGGTSQDSQNIIIGNETGKLATSGKVIMIGHEAGQKSTGVDSLIIGNRAGRTIAGPRNTIIGNKAAGVSNDEANPVLGQDNVLIGTYSGFQLTTGNYNVILGSGDGSNIAGPGTLDTAGAGYALKSGDRNFIAGFNAGRKLISGSENVLVGSQAGAYLGQSNRNILIGKNAGLKLGSNDTLEANSENNVIIGNEAGENITLGNDLLFIGRNAGKNATAGQDNTYLGNYTGENNSGSRNTFIGSRTGNLNEGDNNTMIGTNAGRYSVSSSFNTLIGYEAGRGVSAIENNDGDFNTMIGYQAGQENTEGYRNLYMGHQAGQKNKTGSKNIFMGPNAGLNSTVSKSIFIGAAESNAGGVGINTTGELNILIGPETGVAMTSGTKNVMLGSYTGQKATTASSSVLIGADAGQNITTGDKNVLVGPGTGNQITTGTNNIMMGDRAGNEATTTASENILVGTLAGSKTQIDNSINIGNKAGQNNETGTGNILIGRHAGQKFEQSRNNIMIGSNAGALFYPTGSNITLGENIYIGPEVGKNNVSGLKNIVIGSDAFSSSTHGSAMIAIGYNAAKNACTTDISLSNDLYENTVIGYEAGSQGDYNIRNVMIGSQAGRNVDNARKFQGNVLLGAQTGQNSNLSVNSVVLGSANQTGQGGENNVLAGTNAGNLLGPAHFKKFTTLNALGQTFFNVLVLDENLSVVSKYIHNGDTVLLDDGTTTFQSTVSSLSEYSILFDNLIESGIDVNISVSSNNVAVLYLGDNYVSTTEIGTGASLFKLSITSDNIGDTDTSKASANSLLGYNAGKSLTTGSKNVVLGSDALQLNKIGKYNNILGTQAGFNAITDNNTFLGTKAGYSVDSQTKDTLENYIYNIHDNQITVYFDRASNANLDFTGNTLVFNYGDVIDIDNTSFNDGRYKVESSTLTANSSFTSSLVVDEMTIKVQGFPRYEQLGVPENIGINDVKVNASTYIYDKFTSPVNRNSQFVSILYDGTNSTIKPHWFINSNKYWNGLTEVSINDEVVGFYPVVNVSGSRYNDGYYYCRPDYTGSNYNIFAGYNKLYSEYMEPAFLDYFNSNVNVCEIFTKDFITSGTTFNNILPNSPFYVYLPDINGYYRASRYNTKYLSTIPVNNGIYLEDVSTLLETNNNIISNFFNTKQKTNVVFTNGLTQSISFNGSLSSNDYIDHEELRFDNIPFTLAINLDTSIGEGTFTISSTVSNIPSTLFTVGDIYKLKGSSSSNNNLVIYITYKSTDYVYFFNVVEGTLQNETVTADVEFRKLTFSKLVTDITSDYSRGNILNVNYLHRNGMSVNSGSYFIEDTYFTSTDGYKFVIGESQCIKPISDRIYIPIYNTSSSTTPRYNTTLQKNVELNINKEIYSVDNAYINNSNLHISSQDIIFQTGNIEIYGSNIFTLNSTDNTITSNVKYHFTDLVSPCMIRLDGEYYLVKDNKYPFQTLELDDATVIGSTTTTSGNIEMNTVSSRLGLVDLGNMQQGTEYRIFGGNKNHLNLITPVSNAIAISNTSVFCTSSSIINNYKSNNKQILVESNPDNITELNAVSKGHHDGYFKYLNEDFSNINIVYDNINTLYEPLYVLNDTNNYDMNNALIIPDDTNNKKYNLVFFNQNTSFDDTSSNVDIYYDTSNITNVNNIPSLSSNFALYGEEYNTFTISKYGYLLFESDNHNTTLNFMNEKYNYNSNTDVYEIRTKYITTDNVDDTYLVEYSNDDLGKNGVNNCQIKLFLENADVRKRGLMTLNYSSIYSRFNNQVVVGLETTNTIEKENRNQSNLFINSIEKTPLYNLDVLDNINNKKLLIHSEKVNSTSNISLFDTATLTVGRLTSMYAYGNLYAQGRTRNSTSGLPGSAGYTGSVDILRYNESTNAMDSVQLVYLKTGEGLNSSDFGQNVAISDKFIVISNARFISTGNYALYIGKYNGSTYDFLEAIEVDSATTEQNSYTLISIYNDYIAYGDFLNDRVKIFKYNGSTFDLHQTITYEHNDSSSPFFGTNLHLYGDILAIGARQSDEIAANDGLVLVYRLNSSSGYFELLQKISNPLSSNNSLFGGAVSVYDNLIAVGAPGYNDTRGRAFVFKFNPSTDTYNLVQTFANTTENSNDNFGSGVSIYKNHLLVNAVTRYAINGYFQPSDESCTYYTYDSYNEEYTKIFKFEDGISFGAVVTDKFIAGDIRTSGTYYYYTPVAQEIKTLSTSFVQKETIIPSNVEENNDFGYRTCIYKDYLCVTCRYSNDSKGSVFVYRYNNSTKSFDFNQEIKHTTQDTDFGCWINMYNDKIIVGARLYENTYAQQGAAVIYKKNNNTHLFEHEQTIYANDSGAGDFFGTSAAIYKDRVVIGAPDAEKLTDPGYYQHGMAELWKYNSSTGVYTYAQRLVPASEDRFAFFASKMHMDEYGDVFVCGDNYGFGTNTGIVVYFKWNGTNYTRTQTITGSSSERIGVSLGIFKEWLIIGNSATSYNYVEVWKKNSGGTFVQTQTINSPNPETNFSKFPLSVSLYDNYLAVGNRNADYGSNVEIGIINLFELQSNGVFTEYSTVIDNNAISNVFTRFGETLTLYDNILVATDYDYNNNQGKLIHFQWETTERLYSTSSIDFYNHTANSVGLTEVSNINTILTSSELEDTVIYSDFEFSNITISKYGYIDFESDEYTYNLNILNINTEFSNVYYNVSSNVLNLQYYNTSTSNVVADSYIYLSGSEKAGDIEVYYSNISTLSSSDNGTIGLSSHYINTFATNLNTKNSQVLIRFNDTSNISNSYPRLIDDIDNSTVFDNITYDIISLSNTQETDNSGLFQVTSYNSNYSNDNLYYLGVKNTSFTTEEYNSNINILINQWVGKDISINNIRSMTGEHSDFIRFHKLRENIFNTEFDLVQQNYSNVNILDKSLNFSVNTNQFNNSNITSTNILVLNEQVPNDLIHNYQRDTANIGLFKNVNKYALSLGTPFLVSLSSDSNISLQQEITNINKEPIGFIDIYQECSNINNISNTEIFTFTASTDTHSANIYLDGTLNKISLTDLTYTNIEALEYEIIDGNKKLSKYQPFKKCQPGNIIRVNYSTTATTFNNDYLVSNVSSDFTSVYINPVYRSLPSGNTSVLTSDTTLSYVRLYTGITQSITNQGIKGHIISSRYNFANFTNMSSVDTYSLGSNIDFATGTYLSVIEAPILNNEQGLATGYNSVYYDHAIIPGRSINYYSGDNATFDSSNIQTTMDFGYKAEKLLTKPINIDTGDNILIIPSSNLTIDLQTTDLEYVNQNTTADTSNLTIYFNDNVIVSDNVATDFSKFAKGTSVSCPFFQNETIISNVYMELSTTQDNTSSNLYLLPACSNALAILFEFQSGITSDIITSGQLETEYGAGTDMTFKQIGLYSSNVARTDLSVYKKKEDILVSGTPLNPTLSSNIGTYNSYLVDDSTSNFLQFNEHKLSVDGLTITPEQPDFLKVEKVVINHENTTNRQNVANVNIDYISTSNSIITITESELSTPKINGNFDSFTFDQECAVVIDSSTIYYVTTNELPTPKDLTISVSGIPLDYINSNVQVFKNLKVTRIGSPLDLIVGNQAGIFHYQDAQGNNLMLGSFAGQFSGSKTQCIHNTYIGSKVGQTNHGSGNMFFGSETGLATNSSQGETYFNNKFAIYKNEFIGVKSNPLIGGDFTSGRVGINTINPDNLLSATLSTDTRLIVNGAIRASSHNTFTGTHIISLSASSKLSEIEPGMIVSSTGKVQKLGLIDTIVECELTHNEKDKKVFGIYVNTEHNEYYTDNKGQEKQSELVHYVAGVGEGQIWVSDINGVVEAGDYVCSSSIPGFAMKQDDDLVHNYTIAKITEDIEWGSNLRFKHFHGTNNKIALLGCVYMCS